VTETRDATFQLRVRTMPTKAQNFCRQKALTQNLQESFYSAPGTVRKLIRRGANPKNVKNSEGRTLLHRFAGDHVKEKSAGETMTVLLGAGLDVDIRDNYGQTPLHYAASQRASPSNLRHPKYIHIRILLEAGADPNALDDLDRTPLHCAARCDEYYVDGATIQMLLDAGADPSARDFCGQTPLHHAYCGKNVERLLNAAADFNALDNNGCTPLHTAASSSYCRDMIAKLLLEAGANPNIKSTAGDLPIHTACRHIESDWRESMLICRLMEASPESLSVKSDIDGCYPIMLAAEDSGASENGSATLNTLFRMLKECPEVTVDPRKRRTVHA